MKQLFTGGVIHPVDTDEIYDSMLVEDGIITKIGNGIRTDEPHATIDLNSATVLPAFIDAHSHLTSAAMSMLQTDLSDCGSISDILQRLSDCINAKDGIARSFINAIGYDHNYLAEKRHPTRAELDRLGDIPIVLTHRSNHFGVFNSAALELLGLSSEYGVMQESDFVNAVRKMPMPSIESILKCFSAAQTMYASYGITIVQDGMIVKEMLPIYKELLKSDILFLDTMGYAAAEEREVICAAIGGEYRHFCLHGYKVILDGSPQGKTAWMIDAYPNTSDYHAEGLVSDDRLREYIAAAIRDGKTLLAHCNGDAAAEQLLRVAGEFPTEQIERLRPVIVHAQLLRREQLAEVKRQGMIPSFFVAHVYHYGDVHIENFGRSRAETISPARSAQRLGIPFTFHQDTPVMPPNMIETIRDAVQRRTRSGIVLGEDERLTVAEAVRAVTLNAAYQYGLENETGSLSVGKRADFVILDSDIFSIPEEQIASTRILATYKNGSCIYSAEQPR